MRSIVGTWLDIWHNSALDFVSFFGGQCDPDFIAKHSQDLNSLVFIQSDQKEMLFITKTSADGFNLAMFEIYLIEFWARIDFSATIQVQKFLVPFSILILSDEEIIEICLYQTMWSAIYEQDLFIERVLGIKAFWYSHNGYLVNAWLHAWKNVWLALKIIYLDSIIFLFPQEFLQLADEIIEDKKFIEGPRPPNLINKQLSFLPGIVLDLAPPGNNFHLTSTKTFR